MDELLKALTDAIRTGSQLAYPALMGYYTVRVLEVLIPAVATVSAIFIVARMILAAMRLGYARMEQTCREQKQEIYDLKHPGND